MLREIQSPIPNPFSPLVVTNGSKIPDVRIESGTLVDMVLEREIVVEHERVESNDARGARLAH
jgi:hypothetical protein